MSSLPRPDQPSLWPTRPPLLAALCLLFSGPLQAASPTEPVQFGKQILPLLSDRCFHCHGQDEKSRKADLRLDSLAEASRDLGGYRAISPGNPAQSALIQRMLSTDRDEVMPPPKSHKPMRPEEIELFRRWIEQGATYQKHWAFTPPTRPPVPKLAGPMADWVRNPIDSFVGQKLAENGLQPSPEAPPHTLGRRASLDLTGLPPEPPRVRTLEKALADPQNRDSAWTAYVRELFQSPHFGERMAMFWLDASRYSDTDGFQVDETRTNWPWRDWVIEAFNRNQPYDQFTLEQFAGDLLPEATPEQKLATCFHRNHMTNGEGGRDPEESRTDYVIDRVNTTGALWLGLTLGCAQCHTHKFDPIPQSEFYQLSAFFNSINETGVAGKNAGPYLPYRSPASERAISAAQLQVDQRRLREQAAAKQAEPAFASWLLSLQSNPKSPSWTPFAFTAYETNEGTHLTRDSNNIISASGSLPDQDDYRISGPTPLKRITGLKLEVLPDPTLPAGGPARSDSGTFILTDIKVHIRAKGASQARELNVTSAVADYTPDPKKHNGYGDIIHTFDDDPRNGWANFDRPPSQPHVAVWALAHPETLSENEEVIVELRQRALLPRHTLARFRISLTDHAGPAVHTIQPAPLDVLFALPSSRRHSPPEPLRSQLKEEFLADHRPYLPFKEALDLANANLTDTKALAEKLQVMVLEEKTEPRPTHILLRGQWDKPGDAVTPGILSALAPWKQGDRRSRVELARWLTAPENPLTARVTVNHLWQLLFGEGLVRTPEDFGVQGEPPTHPELLDWLAVELMENQWNLRHVLRLIATSATYRQSSNVSPDLLARDPANRLLARASRFRLPAWILRDSALHVSGLLNPALGGPPVRPYQPAGVWEDITMGRFKYRPTEGPEQYRRTLYAFWRRSASPAFLFDNAQRRVCEVRSPRTNTPLHALTLMNDLTYREAARTLAERTLQLSKNPSPVAELFERVLFRKPSPEEISVLEQQFNKALAWYSQNPAEAAKAITQGQSPPNPKLAPDRLAAASLVSSLILNLDETLNRE
jgi:hypothetical protein